MKLISQLTIIILISSNLTMAQSYKMKTISKNGMTVNYAHNEGKVSFEISAPTAGWVTIGFNEQPGMKDSHLVMCRVVNGNPEIVEHYTIGVGNYRSIKSLNGKNAISNIKGSQVDNNIGISFEIDSIPVDKYHKDLSQGKEYHITLAYSQSDDFQHHSIMRTSIKSIL